jgi:hypothetical protein
MSVAILSPDQVAAPDAISLLRAHATIGWDLDMTLLGHPASDRLHAFIRATPEIRHVIVTFRSHSRMASIWSDLAKVPLAADIGCFVAAETIDDAMASHFQRLRRNRAQRLYAGPNSPAEMAYLRWKGEVCARWGATLLIDDMTEHVRHGCEASGIQLLHPDIFR